MDVLGLNKLQGLDDCCNFLTKITFFDFNFAFLFFSFKTQNFHFVWAHSSQTCTWSQRHIVLNVSKGLRLRACERQKILSFVVLQNSKHGQLRNFWMYRKYRHVIITFFCEIPVPTEILIEYMITITERRAVVEAFTMKEQTSNNYIFGDKPRSLLVRG